jgi:hypothetical protein
LLRAPGGFYRLLWQDGPDVANGRKLDAGRGLRDGAIVAAVVAFEGLLTWALLFVAGLDSLNRGDSQWWQVAKLLFHGMVWSQWTGGLGLGALTGLMFAAGVGRRRLTMPLLVASLAVGAVVPVGFLILAGMLDGVWPITSGPMDAPLLMMLLAAYAIGVPWGLGRVIRRSAWTR